ncbi:MAG: IS30 family transposase [Gammaproteobacteria bacterium]|nr:IS30 family transposase [Gammaproteobacteria bacterium]
MQDRGLLSSGHSTRSIARQLRVTATTVSRELRRNSDSHGSYDANREHQRAVKRRHDASSRPRKVTERHLEYIDERLVADWSPDVIAHKTSDLKWKLSTPGSYELIDRDVQADKDNWTTMLLRKYRKQRGPRKGGGAAQLIPDRVDIDQRPVEVDTRETFCHWEGDTVKTITFDNGLQFADLQHIAAQLNCDIYFAKPTLPGNAVPMRTSTANCDVTILEANTSTGSNRMS